VKTRDGATTPRLGVGVRPTSARSTSTRPSRNSSRRRGARTPTRHALRRTGRHRRLFDGRPKCNLAASHDPPGATHAPHARRRSPHGQLQTRRPVATRIWKGVNPVARRETRADQPFDKDSIICIGCVSAMSHSAMRMSALGARSLSGRPPEAVAQTEALRRTARRFRRTLRRQLPAAYGKGRA
jgi:hypothetical protein